jgi:predicted ATPase/class 3 adenylate cyclase
MTTSSPMPRLLAVVMFTDMVGSTSLFESNEALAVEKRETYLSAVRRHHADHDGTVVSWLGDGTMSTFSSALAAVEAAVGMQRDLVAAHVDVRIGLHIGEVIAVGDTIIGDSVNVASRIESFAQPGTVLASAAVRDQLKGCPEVGTLPLGEFRLKNVGKPLELFGIVAEGIVRPDRAQLEGKGQRLAVIPSRLPSPVTPLVGRESDLQSVLKLARSNRLLTVTGPGGVGKTRLLVQIGRELVADAPDGLAFIDLSEIAEPGLFLAELARALDVKEAQGREILDGIVNLLGDRNVVLLLDNLEQISEAGRDVSRILERCENVRAVTTSRVPLRVAGEHVYPLAPLPLPGSASSPAVVRGNQSVQLFFSRAAAAGCPLDDAGDDVLAAVAAICRRLDGLPLALELAAPRLRVLTPASLNDRLDRALDLLSTTNRDKPSRQQTLRATIDWSHSLLNDASQRVFRRLAIFADGAGVDDVDAVCGFDGTPVLDALESLVEMALVRIGGSGHRVTMLQTIAEYAQQKLAASGERRQLAERHARHYAALAERIRAGIECEAGVRGYETVEQGIAEDANLAAALDTLGRAAEDGDNEAARLGMLMCGRLKMYWHVRGMNLTALERASTFLRAFPEADGVPGAAALRTRGLGHWALGHFEEADKDWAEAVRLAAGAGDPRELAISELFWSAGLLGSDPAAGLASSRTAAATARACNYAFVEGLSATFEGMMHQVLGELVAAREAFKRGLDVQLRIGDHEGAGLSLGGLAALAATTGQGEEALSLYARSLESFALIGDRAEEARILEEVAWLQLDLGAIEFARRRFVESVQAYRDIFSVRGIGVAVAGLAAVEATSGRDELAVRLAGAAEAHLRGEGVLNVYAERERASEQIDLSRKSLGSEALERATRAGQAMSIDEIVAAVG